MRTNIDEALRYLGVGGDATDDLRYQAEQVAKKLEDTLQPRYTYQVFPLLREEAGLRLAGTNVLLSGDMARRMLQQCDRAALLACTLGSRFDVMLLAEQSRDMASAAILDACGSAYVEAGCDEAEQELAQRLPGLYLTDRFSPGYGDLPLNIQPVVCNALDARRRLGVYVGEHYLMNPVKTVTAVIGISDRPQMARIRGCAFCAMRETCNLRKGGKRCGL